MVDLVRDSEVAQYADFDNSARVAAMLDPTGKYRLENGKNNA